MALVSPCSGLSLSALGRCTLESSVEEGQQRTRARAHTPWSRYLERSECIQGTEQEEKAGVSPQE